MRRRSFLGAPALAGFAPEKLDAASQSRVIATGDGVPHSPAEYGRLLAGLTEGLEADSYSRGGVIARLEQKMAATLGKEAAVWFPTGTLANHVAARLLAGDRRRVLIQQESHLYNDSGDCAQTLSGLHMVPLAAGMATFTLAEVEREASRAAGSRVSVPIGAIVIETPVRRRTGEAFDFAEMKKISAWARDHKVGTHLDGARLLLASAYSGIAPREYAALFDTVYVSMYKYFNSASGAILAGPRKLMDELYHTRRMFGGGLNQVWPFAAVALHYAEGFEQRFASAVATSEQVIAALQKDGNFEIRRVPGGTNIFLFRVRGVNAAIYQQRIDDAGFTMGAPDNEWFQVRVNETWNRASAAEILDRFRKGMG